jgi:hypothetical protein
MNEQNALEKNKRCPKGFVRNKEGVCVPKVTKQTDIIDNTTPTKVPKEKVPKEKVPKEKVPKEKVPKEKVPKEKVPNEKVPKEKVLKEKVPKEKVLKEKVPKEKVPKEKVPKEPVTTNTVNKRKKVSPKAKTMKKMTKIDAIELLTERRECIKNIRNNLTIIH